MLVAGSVVIKPDGEFKLTISPGFILEGEEGENGACHEPPEHGELSSGREAIWVARQGLGYSIERPSAVITAAVYFELLDGREDAVDLHVVFGVSIEFPF